MTDNYRQIAMDMLDLCRRWDDIGGGHAAQPLRDFAFRILTIEKVDGEEAPRHYIDQD